MPEHDSTIDKPRRIICVNAADFPAVQKAVMALRLGDVLVKASPFVEPGAAIVMDPSILDDPFQSGGSS